MSISFREKILNRKKIQKRATPTVMKVEIAQACDYAKLIKIVLTSEY